MVQLRAVGDDEAPKSGKKLTILAAIEAGDRLAELEATHRRIGKAVQDETTPARDLASLTRRQMEISKEIESLRRQQAEEEAERGASADEAWNADAI